ncbi:chaperonin GroEL, partial [Candidatus Saccharibacteria bacterium]|nr:chaperonin GroEL [Candidatus Saccharibacteria bacterium]
DMAILTDATVVSEEKGLKLEEVGLEVLGSAVKVIATKDETTVIKGAGDKKAVADRIELIGNYAKQAKSDYEREEFEKRAAALSGKVAVIKVGGATETEIDEKKFRVDDAVAATKAALAEGIVTGGGVTLVNLAGELSAEDAGVRIVKEALKTPFVHIVENAGLNAQALLAEVEKAKPGYGVNVMKPSEGLVNLKKAGVIDPAKVTKEAVKSATSIAATAITMGALICEIPEEKPAAPDMGGMY